MSARLLIASLKAQDVNLSLLLEAMDLQKQAIIKNDYTTLESAINNEQKILFDVEREENTRNKVVKELSKTWNLELRENSMESLINQAGNYLGNELNELQVVRKSMREKVNKIKSTNTQLKDVIDFSRNMIKETMMMVVGPNKRALINKRV
ncbi:MAG: FlgN family protein [Ignavibacteria bacterium]|nr:MAG: FlgN family protein [Ignavibacteria bacterium]KAF0160151.1 MAG: FlgN family protein [Ignavibacteria bacterium]